MEESMMLKKIEAVLSSINFSRLSKIEDSLLNSMLVKRNSIGSIRKRDLCMEELDQVAAAKGLSHPDKD